MTNSQDTGEFTTPDGMQMFTIEQVAKVLVVSPNTVRNLIARGELGSTKVARTRRITEAALRAYQQGGCSTCANCGTPVAVA